MKTIKPATESKLSLQVQDTLSLSLIVFILSLAFLSIGLILSVYLLSILAAIWLILICYIAALWSYFAGKKDIFVRWLNPIFNSIACGFLISIYYLQTGKNIDYYLGGILLGTLFVLFSITYLSFKTQRLNLTMLIINITIGCAGAIISIILWDKQNVFFQQVLFASLFYISFILGQVIYIAERKNFWLCISIVYFVLIAIALLVAVFILGEGAAFDGLGGSFSGIKQKKKKKSNVNKFDFLSGRKRK